MPGRSNSTIVIDLLKEVGIVDPIKNKNVQLGNKTLKCVSRYIVSFHSIMSQATSVGAIPITLFENVLGHTRVHTHTYCCGKLFTIPTDFAGQLLACPTAIGMYANAVTIDFHLKRSGCLFFLIIYKTFPPHNSTHKLNI